MKIFTIGVYGKTADQFFSALTEHQIDVFCDIRQRRGLRGSIHFCQQPVVTKEIARIRNPLLV